MTQIPIPPTRAVSVFVALLQNSDRLHFRAQIDRSRKFVTVTAANGDEKAVVRLIRKASKKIRL